MIKAWNFPKTSGKSLSSETDFFKWNILGKVCDGLFFGVFLFVCFDFCFLFFVKEQCDMVEKTQTLE